MDDKLLSQIMVEAFPVVCYLKQLQDGSRKIMEIIEGVSFDGKTGNVSYKTLYKYRITENKKENGKVIIKGKHIKEDIMSDNLKRTFLDNGLTNDELSVFLKKGES